LANTAAAGEIPPTVRWSFYLGGLVYLLAVLRTILTVKEYSPSEQEEFNQVAGEVTGKEGPAIELNIGRYLAEGSVLVVAGSVFAYFVHSLQWDKALYILGFGIAGYGAFQLLAALRFSAGKIDGLVEIIYDLKNMPRTMTQLALVTVLTWFALFAMFIYANSAVTTYHFGSTDTRSVAYNDGANWVGVLMAVYNGVAALVAPFLPYMARKTGRVGTHVICLIIGGLGLISMYLFRDPKLLLVSMSAVGIAWASLLTMPYAILSSAVPHQKMGVYMGMFNLFVVIPQILASASLGLLLRTVFHGHAIYALVLGGVVMVLAGFAMLFVKDMAKAREIS
jgi:maltose/moltooligosaccharide transporter